MLESFADNKFTYQKLTEDEQRKRINNYKGDISNVP